MLIFTASGIAKPGDFLPLPGTALQTITDSAPRFQYTTCLVSTSHKFLASSLSLWGLNLREIEHIFSSEYRTMNDLGVIPVSLLQGFALLMSLLLCGFREELPALQFARMGSPKSSLMTMLMVLLETL